MITVVTIIFLPLLITTNSVICLDYVDEMVDCRISRIENGALIQRGGALIRSDNFKLQVGASVLLMCNPDYAVTGGSNKTICQANGRLFPILGKCTSSKTMPAVVVPITAPPVQCQLPVVANAAAIQLMDPNLTGPFVPSGAVINLYCNFGFRVTGGTGQSVCSKNGEWLPALGNCQPLPTTTTTRIITTPRNTDAAIRTSPVLPPLTSAKCQDPIVRNAYVNRFDDAVFITCENGFKLVNGARQAICSANGIWSPGLGLCQKILETIFTTTTKRPINEDLSLELNKAACKSKLDYVSELLQRDGIDVNWRDSQEFYDGNIKANTWIQGATALHRAAYCDASAQIIRLLLDNGGEINAKEDNKYTSLMLAAMNGNIENMRILLNRGADVSLRDRNGQTALSLAAERGNTEAVQLLVEKQSGLVNDKSTYNESPLMLAARNGFLEVVRILVNQNAELDAKDITNQSALQYAASYGNDEIARLLIRRGASRNGCSYAVCNN